MKPVEKKPDLNRELELNWQRLLYRIKPRFKRKPNLQSLLFLIGVQELGQFHREFTKEEKQDLMHIGICTLMSQQGYYEFHKRDTDGWPHFRPTTKERPEGLHAQETFLKEQILIYFKKLDNIAGL